MMFIFEAAGLTLVLLAVSFLAPQPALAYLDPGAGSMVFQWIIAGFVGSAFALRIMWRRISVYFQGKKAAAGDDGDL
jgi:hypothetical protein